MAAIITENFRRLSTRLFLDDLKSKSEKYYVGIGKSDPWIGEGSSSFNVPLPTGTANEQKEILSNLTTLIQVQDNDAGLVIPNIKYKANSYYKEYNPTDDSCFFPSVSDSGITINPCYMTTSAGFIFLCIKSGLAFSTDIPNTSSVDYYPQKMNDGYIWILIDDININSSSVINTNQFISISTGSIASAKLTASTTATGNLLYGFTILNGGSGYSAAISNIPFKWHTSDSQQPMNCPIEIDTNGTITKISLPVNYDYDKRILGGYFDFSVFAGGSGAVIVPRIAPTSGFAHTPSQILPAWYVSVAISADDNINSDGLYTPYRQISLVKNPIVVNGVENNSTLGTLMYAQTPNTPNTIADLNLLRTGDIIEFTNNATRAFYDTYDLVDGEYRLYFHQNDNTGYGPINIVDAGSFKNISGNNKVYNYELIKGNEYTASTGTVVFIENRKAISRAENQTEQIKIIIQL
jgi:hypothetical protein